MKRRSIILGIASTLAALCTHVFAQQTPKVPIVGYLAVVADADDPLLQSLKEGLRELGYVNGRNFQFEFRSARGHVDRLPALAHELVQLRADVIVVVVPHAAEAILRATSTTPIVIALFDAVASGLVSSLSHPGAQITGLSSATTELYAKRLQLLKDAIPSLKRVGVLWNPEGMPPRTKVVKVLKAVAPNLSVELYFSGVKVIEDVPQVLFKFAQTDTQAVYIIESPLFYVNRKTLSKQAIEARLPAIYGFRGFAEEGGLISYGIDYARQMRQAAGYVDKILRGAKPTDLPIQEPTQFELVVNLKTAKALGITIPESILVRADEVIR